MGLAKELSKRLDAVNEISVLGQGMSKKAKAADVDQSDREYILQKQKKEVIAREVKLKEEQKKRIQAKIAGRMNPKQVKSATMWIPGKGKVNY